MGIKYNKAQLMLERKLERQVAKMLFDIINFSNDGINGYSCIIMGNFEIYKEREVINYKKMCVFNYGILRTDKYEIYEWLPELRKEYKKLL